MRETLWVFVGGEGRGLQRIQPFQYWSHHGQLFGEFPVTPPILRVLNSFLHVGSHHFLCNLPPCWVLSRFVAEVSRRLCWYRNCVLDFSPT